LNCLRHAIDASNISYDGSLEWFIGPPTNTWAAKLMPDADKETQDLLLATFRARYEAEGWAQNSVYEGIPELLTALRKIIREEGLSAILVEQNAQKILGVTDLAIIVERGRIVHQSDSASLQANRALLETYVGVTDVRRQARKISREAPRPS
jgi:phosphoglycolate phosphatase-like HAD superfamily hydrolase